MKALIMIGMMMTTMTVMADVKFKVNSAVENISGVFKTAKISRKGNNLIGFIEVKSMELSKKDKKEDLMDYFDARKHPLTTFKGKIIGGAIEGVYELKGKIRKMKGIVNGKEAIIKIPLTDLVTGFKAMFLNKGDHIEMKLEIK